MVDDDPRKQKMRIGGIKVLGSTSEIQKLVAQRDVGIILFAISNIEPEERLRIISMCNHLPVHTVLIPNVVEMMRDEFRCGLAHKGPQVPSGLSTAQLNHWLQHLEDLIEEKNFDAVQMQIEHLRAELLVRHHE
jgi:FlaA1/EpsC-like NDP-sugar epimerase